MAQLVVAAAGAVIGGMIGGPAGAKIGWMVGSTVGAFAGPSAKSYGPRLSDTKVTASEYGAGIPVIFGCPRAAGIVIWASDAREIATTTRQGKGGGAKSTTYTYERDLLILLADNACQDVRRCWSTGGLVWSLADSSDGETIAASDDTTSWRAIRFYDGADDQLPDPAYEAAVGTADAPAYIGRSMVALEGVNLGSSGQLPNLTFEILRKAAYTAGESVALYDFTVSAADKTVYGNDLSLHGGATLTSAGLRLEPNWAGIYGYAQTAASASMSLAGDFTIQAWVRIDVIPSYSVDILGLRGGGWPLLVRMYETGEFWVQLDNSWTQIGPRYQLGLRTHLAIGLEGSQLRVWMNGVLVGVAPHAMNLASPYLGIGGFSGLVEALKLTKDRCLWGAENFVPPGAPFGRDVGVSTVREDLAEVVAGICAACGLEDDDIDVSDLAGIALDAYAITPSTGRGALEQLAAAYYFECYETDRLVFVRRGKAPVATVLYEHNSANALLTLQEGNDLELPATVNVTYANLSNSYQQGNEVSDRLTTDSTATTTVSLALGLLPARAKGIADTAVMDMAVASRTFALGLDRRWAALCPTNVVLLEDGAGMQHRARIVKISVSDGALSLDSVADDARVLQAAGITADGGDGDYRVSPLARADLVLLDIPLLRDADDAPGLYAAGDGLRGRFPGYLLQRDGVDVGTSTTGAAMGFAAEMLGNWTSLLVDERSVLTVTLNAGDTLASITHADLATSTDNYAAIGAPGRWEIVQFQRAALVSAGVYRITGFARGRLGTEYLRGTHQAGDRFVQLDGAGLLRDTANLAGLGLERSYSATTLGATMDKAATLAITPVWEGLKPLAPVNVRQRKQGTGDIAIDWGRRSRYVSNVLAGVLPLAEAAEAYEVDILSGGTVVRTLTSTASDVVYTQSQQVADFGAAQASVAARIYQLSASIGRGHAASI